MAAPILEVKDICRTITVDKREKRVVCGVTYQFHPEKIYTVIGPSGSGKSSFLRLLNRLDEPTGGKVLFHGKDATQYAPCELRQKIGYLFQTPHLFDGSVRDNLLYANKDLSGEDIDRLVRRAHIKAEQVDTATDNMSVGEKQRVAIARLLATRPEMILLDEPTSALDPSVTIKIEELIKEIAAQERLTVIMVTHNPEQALRLGQEALLMHDGEVVETGSAEGVINSPKSKAGQAYKARELQ